MPGRRLSSNLACSIRGGYFQLRLCDGSGSLSTADKEAPLDEAELVVNRCDSIPR
jgi:hypothetical protein